MEKKKRDDRKARVFFFNSFAERWPIPTVKRLNDDAASKIQGPSCGVKFNLEEKKKKKAYFLQ